MDYKDFDLGELVIASSGMDDFLSGGAGESAGLRDLVASDEPQKIRVASVSQLKGFTRVANDTLVRKSERDLWSLNQTEDGWVIERLFDEDGNPLKV